MNTSALQTHLLATNKGKAYHKQRQQLGKPLENPFIGYVFSDNTPGKREREGYMHIYTKTAGNGREKEATTQRDK